MNKRRILYISFLGILEPVAFSQVFSYLIKLAEDKSLKFTLLTLEKDSFLQKKDYLRYEEIREKLSRVGIDWYMLKHHRGLGKIYDLFIAFLCAMAIVIRRNINIIHARSNEPVILAFFIAKFLRIKIIYDRRGMMAEDYSDDATTNFKIKRGGFVYKLINQFEFLIMRSCNAIVVLTEKIFNHLTKDGFFRTRNNIFIVPCCVELERFGKFHKDNVRLLSQLGLSNKIIFNYTGSLCGLHCLSEMLDFFKTAKKSIPSAHLMFLTLVNSEFIKNSFKVKGLDVKDVTVISVSPLEVNKYMSICDLAVMFFKPTFIRWAASPTKLAECLASGLPIIINKNIGDTEVLVNKNMIGAVLDDFSQSSYIKAVNQAIGLLNDPDIRLRCRKSAEDNFSISRGVEAYHNIYNSL